MTGRPDAPPPRDAGLRRALGPWSLGANVVNIVVGAGIFVLPSALYRELGAAAPWAYVACTVVMAGVTLCFAAAGSRVATSGGPYGAAEVAFGPMVGFISGFLIWASNVLAAGGIVAGVADLAGRAAPALAAPFPRAGLIAGVLGAMAAVNVAGVGWGATLVRWTAAVKLAPLALLLLGAALFAGSAPSAAAAAPAPSAAGFGRAMLLAIFAFQGMESALSVSGEVRDPARNVPRALFGAMIGAAALYVLLQLASQRALGPALAASPAPLADAGRALWPPLGALLLAGTAASMTGYLAGDALSSPRLLFAFARDGLAPRALQSVAPRTGAPVTAVLTHAALVGATALSGGFEPLVILAALAVVPVYAIGCAAAVVLQRRDVETAGEPLRVPGLWAAAAVGLAGMAWLLTNGKPVELLGLAAVMVAAGAIYAVARRRRPLPA